jgi:hypothetical protein
VNGSEDQKENYWELDRELPSRRRAATIQSKSSQGHYDLRTWRQWYLIHSLGAATNILTERVTFHD